MYFVLPLLFTPVSPLLTVLGFLTGRAGTVGTGDILLFLRFGLHLVVTIACTSSTTEGDAVLQDALKIVFLTHVFTFVMVESCPPLLERGDGGEISDGTVLLP